MNNGDEKNVFLFAFSFLFCLLYHGCCGGGANCRNFPASAQQQANWTNLLRQLTVWLTDVLSFKVRPIEPAQLRNLRLLKKLAAASASAPLRFEPKASLCFRQVLLWVFI